MISGTRHEKVALVITSYVIGFITAYIGFGINQLISAQLATVIPEPTYIPSLVKKEPKSEKVISLIMGKDGLSAVTQDQSIILSANKSALGASVIESTAGFHASIIGAETAPDALFVYYCEQALETDENCTPYVFALADEKVHKLTINDEKVDLPIETHKAFWTDENLLSISGALSIDAARPWILMQETDELGSSNEESSVSEDVTATEPVAEDGTTGVDSIDLNNVEI